MSCYADDRFYGLTTGPNRQVRRPSALQPTKKVVDNLRISIALSDSAMTSRVNNEARHSEAMQSIGRMARKDKKDRRTVDLVIDHRTKLILYKLMNKELFTSIEGCVSTGKEANVYYAYDFSGRELAIKVYKTSILVFKDRERYVVGDSRFSRG